MFLSTAEVMILLFYFFDTIVIENASVLWLSNQAKVFTACHVFHYIEYPWLQIFHRFLFWIELVHNGLDCVRIEWRHFWDIFLILGCILLWNWYNIRDLLNYGLYVALILIEDQRLVKCWSLYFSEIDRISESCWMLGFILIWNWYNIRGLWNAGVICR